MNLSLLNPEIQQYISQNLHSDSTALVLKGITFEDVSTLELVEQIEAKSKSEKKLPTWFKLDQIYYPNKLNIEQTSSEVTANYKSQLIGGKTLIDLTGGFGVDCYYYSKKFEQVTYCEVSPELQKIVKHNFEILNIQNASILNQDGIGYLKDQSAMYDWIYVDPSRRHEQKGKVFFLKDCLPNIPEHLSVLWSRSKHIMIKTSPLLDITSGIGELQYVKSIHVLAVNNEVKELLWILEYGFIAPVKIYTANLKTHSTENFDFYLDQESETVVDYSEPLQYLYEPNSAILKSGGFNTLVSNFNVKKLHKHSHLYTSTVQTDFPGRKFIIKKSLPYNKKKIKDLQITKANITTRNFPETVADLRKIFKIKDGGSHYLFFTTNPKNEKIVIICTKVP